MKSKKELDRLYKQYISQAKDAAITNDPEMEEYFKEQAQLIRKQITERNVHGDN